MAVFNTPRADRTSKNYMEKLVYNIFNTGHQVLFRQGYGVLANSAEAVLQAFRMVQNNSQSLQRIKVHSMELFVEFDKNQEDVIKLTDTMGRYFYGQGFQCLATVILLEGRYLVEFVINAVSYMDGRAFHDNNNNYLNILYLLRSITPYDWNVSASDAVFFEQEKDMEVNYRKGVLS